MSTLRDTLAANLARVEERITAACQRAGRPRDAVTLVAVTKTVDVEVARQLVELGVRDLGENRPQELWHKAPLLPADVHWHLIGHLQRNKIERTVPLVHRIHSVDSLRLLQALDTASTPRPLGVLVEVNCSGEASKQGFAPESLGELVAAVERLRRVRVTGLMTMAAFEEDPHNCRMTFERLWALRQALQAQLGPAYPLPELSMGMSNDFEVAIEAGATMVRLGSVLFEGLQG